MIEQSITNEMNWWRSINSWTTKTSAWELSALSQTEHSNMQIKKRKLFWNDENNKYNKNNNKVYSIYSLIELYKCKLYNKKI